ncbi:TetR/AcrR family transcriptional regulator C-terminal domain-containing protein [Actinoplanes sp. GCM10030250]|uniref:TetR/AcrR family transcriptional regulator C-terminal domain-containing protein n=1 Tax=Actinoplanes sp. GCM10030250 TaxID=3273376 RepID=UPI00361164A8
MPDFTDSVWTRPPRTRGDQPSLTREQIVRTAIELLDAEGAVGLSMRRLGTRLGSGATSLYWHVAHKDELLELAVDEVLGEIYVPEPGDTSWRIGASVLANGMRSALLRHAWVIGLLGTRPTIGPNAMRMGNRMVALFTAAGFTGLELSHACALLQSHAIGAATTEAAIAASLQRTGVDPVDVARRLEPYLDRTAADNPDYDRWRREVDQANQNPYVVFQEGFAFGLERILDGLELWLGTRKA